MICLVELDSMVHIPIKMLQISTFVWLKKPPFLLAKHQVLLVKNQGVQVKQHHFYRPNTLKFHGESTSHGLRFFGSIPR